MTLLELITIAIGLSMDAFAVAVCGGLSMQQVTIKKSLIIGLYFGIFQAIMPLAGYALAIQFADRIIAFDHWVAFGLLSIIGINMILESRKPSGCSDRECPVGKCSDRACPSNAGEISLAFATMIPLALATSIDALAVGVSFALLQVNIIPAVIIIGLITLIISMAGVKIGNLFGTKIKSKAELLGGIILILIGLKILFEHLDFF